MRGRLLLAILLLSTAAGCDSDRSGGEDGPRTLQVQVSGEPEETRVYQAVSRAFEEANDGVEIDLVEVPEKDEHLAKLTTAFAGGEPPDVFLVNFREYSQFVVRGAVTPFADYLEDNKVDLADYFEQPIEAFTYQNELQCMPQNISSLVVYYNEDLFEGAGLRRPEAGWSWQDFRRTALALTTGEVHGLGIEPNIIRIAPFVWSNGGEIVDDPDVPTRFTLGDAASREAVEFLVSLVREDKVVPSEQDIAAQDLETRFVSGKLGMFLSSRRDTPVLREVQGLRWDVAALPVGREPAGILHSDAYCLAAGASEEQTALAARFIAFATGEQGQTITALGGRTVPSLREIARSGAFLDPTQPPAHSEVFLNGIDYIRRTPVLATWPEIEDVTEEILTRLFYEEDYTLEQGLKQLEEQTAPLFQEGSDL